VADRSERGRRFGTPLCADKKCRDGLKGKEGEKREVTLMARRRSPGKPLKKEGRAARGKTRRHGEREGQNRPPKQLLNKKGGKKIRGGDDERDSSS